MRREMTIISLLAGVPLLACSSDSASDDSEPGQSEREPAGSSQTDASTRADARQDTDSSGSDSGRPATGGDGGQATPDGPPAGSGDSVFFRADSLVLRSPEIVLQVGLELPIGDQAQTHLNEALGADSDPDNNGNGLADTGDGDGFVDLSMLLRFDQTGQPALGEGGQMLIGAGLCPYPYSASAVCEPNPEAPFREPALRYTNEVDCALDGTSRVASGRCFSTDKEHLELSLPLLGRLPLEHGQVIGAWVDDGQGGIVNGEIRGFLTEQAAKDTKLVMIPAHVAVLGIQNGSPVTDFFPIAREKDEAGTPGWWFAVSFTAKPARFEAAASARSL